MTTKKRTLAEVGEGGLLARVRRLLDPPPPGTVGIGDDTAVVPSAGPALLTTDVMVEGTHFRRTWFRPEEVGHKALAANLSDAAAMSGRPTHAVVSLVLPPRTPVQAVEPMYRGMLRLARTHEVALIGGNVARGKTISVTIALLGDFPHGDPILRTGSRPGHRLYVSGQPGLAGLGFRLLRTGSGRKRTDTFPDLWHSSTRGEPRWRGALARGKPWARRALKRFLTPEPRLEPSRALSFYRLSSLIDTSDGLGPDLFHLAEGGNRIVVDIDRLPLPRGFQELAETLGQSPEMAALWGGEDYELLFSLPPEAAIRLGPRPVVGGTRLTEIGEITSGTGVVLRGKRGERPLSGSGFRHF
jgi:thiamine-monophosphate kinase